MIRSPSPYLLLILTMLIWSGNFVVGRAMHGSIPPIALSFWRWTGALILVLPLAYPHLRTQMPLIRSSWKKLVLYGFLGVACFNTFIYIALQSTTATNALLINSFIPVLIIALSWLFGGTKLTVRQGLGVAISLAGVITIICRADLKLLLSLHFNSGDLWVFLAVICWASYTCLLRQRPAGLHPLSFLCSIILCGVVCLAPLYVWELSQGLRMIMSPFTFAGICYVSLFASVLAFIMWNHSVSQIGANQAGLFLHLMPVFGTILSIIFLGEAFQMYQSVGIGLIFSGIYLTTAV